MTRIIVGLWLVALGLLILGILAVAGVMLAAAFGTPDSVINRLLAAAAVPLLLCFACAIAALVVESLR